MPALRINVDGKESLIDLDNLMLSEIEVLEEHAGVDLTQLSDMGSLKKVRFVGHLLWLAHLRTIAASEQISLHKAALLHPRDDFDISVADLAVELVDAPKSSAGPRTRTTRTPRTGSSAPRKRSAKKPAPGVERSPST